MSQRHLWRIQQEILKVASGLLSSSSTKIGIYLQIADFPFKIQSPKMGPKVHKMGPKVKKIIK